VYSSLNIAATCAVDSGSVTVQHNFTVLPGATLVAVTGDIDGFGNRSRSSDLTGGGNFDVQAGLRSHSRKRLRSIFYQLERGATQ
jgi:hypothetical protein